MKQQKIYVVTSDVFAEYHIDAIFLDKEKAELYKETHEYDTCGNVKIEEYVTSDDKLYTPYECCRIKLDFALVNNHYVIDNITFKYFKRIKEDECKLEDAWYITDQPNRTDWEKMVECFGEYYPCYVCQVIEKEVPLNLTHEEFEKEVTQIFHDSKILISDAIKDIKFNKPFYYDDMIELEKALETCLGKNKI